MFKDREKLLKIIHGLFDLAVVGLSFIIAFIIRKHLNISPFPPFDENFSAYAWLISFIILVWWHLLAINQVNNKSHRGKSLRKVISGILKTNLQGLLLIGFILFILKDEFISRSLILIFAVVCSFTLIIEKIILYKVLKKIRRLERNLQHALIIGTGNKASKLISLIQANRDAGFRIIGILGKDSKEIGEKINGIPIIDVSNHLSQILHHNVVDEVFIALSMQYIRDIETMVIECEQLGVNTRIMVQVVEPSIASVYVDEIFNTSFITFTTRNKKVNQQYLKMLIDYIITTALIIMLFPVLIIISLFIKLDSHGPILFKQTRAGMNGRRFVIFKFRSMYENSEAMRFELEDHNEMTGPVFKISNDRRVTRVGKFLRRTSLDELPQLFNVLKGEMSLVGPRPLFVYESDKISGVFRRRLSMKPGITGLWQIAGRNDINFDEWMTLDLNYIDNWSLWLDTKILFKTLSVPLTKKGAY